VRRKKLHFSANEALWLSLFQLKVKISRKIEREREKDKKHTKHLKKK
jgi:hypothetical protein